jgi:hypothetical protein
MRYLRGVTASPAIGGAPEVPTQVFEKFFEGLTAAGLPAEVVARLKKTLVEDKTFTDRALKVAVLSEEPLP